MSKRGVNLSAATKRRFEEENRMRAKALEELQFEDESFEDGSEESINQGRSSININDLHGDSSEENYSEEDYPEENYSEEDYPEDSDSSLEEVTSRHMLRSPATSPPRSLSQPKSKFLPPLPTIPSNVYSISPRKQTPGLSLKQSKTSVKNVNELIARMEGIHIKPTRGKAQPNIHALLYREATETPIDFAFRKALTLQLSEIENLNVTTAVVLGHMLMKKAKTNIKYNSEIEGAISYILSFLIKK